MSNRQPITDLLQKAKSGDRNAANEIIRHFWESARQAARRNLQAAVRRYKSGSDIANAALRSAISELEKAKSAFASRDEFENLILKIVDRKKKSATRHVLAEKRDARRTKAFDDKLSMTDDDDPKKRVHGDVREQRDTTVESVLAEELAQRVADIVNTEPDPARLAIAEMGVIQRLEPTEISSALAAGGTKVFALRTIQKIVQDAKKKVARALREEYGELVPPVPPKTSKKGDKDTSTKGKNNAETRRTSKASKTDGEARSKKEPKKGRNK
jgi:predicted DNA-binding protein (UPF0251 family)